MAAGSILVGSRRLYLVEKGSSGPAVIFEAGIAATNLNWFLYSGGGLALCIDGLL